ncbi:MAG: hypothetical protein WC761_01235 [Candidatus Paceibacterota bacterium]|jgi:hypothetical protein
MSNQKTEKYEMPLILYEEPSSRGEKGIPFPYIEIQKEKVMPPVLFIFEYKHTGEVEPDDNGKDAAIIDQIPHKYIDMEYLKEKLSAEVNDVIRVAVGMKPLKQAQVEGQKVLDRVFAKVEGITEQAIKERDQKLQDAEENKQGKKSQ